MVVHFLFQWDKCINLLSTYYYVVDILADTEDIDMNQRITVGENRKNKKQSLEDYTYGKEAQGVTWEWPWSRTNSQTVLYFVAGVKTPVLQNQYWKHEEVYFIFE